MSARTEKRTGLSTTNLMEHMRSGADRREYPRAEMYAGIFLVQGERAFLTEMQNVSAGGLSVVRPGNWQLDADGHYQLFCILEQDRILYLRGKVSYQEEQRLGFEFEPGYAVQAEQLLVESKNWR